MGLKSFLHPDKDALAKLVSNFFRNLLGVYIVLFIFDYVSPGYVEFYIDLDWLLYPLVVTGAASLIFYAQKLKSSNNVRFEEIKRLISYVFLVMLLITTAQSFAPELMIDWMTLLMLTAIALGVVTFYLNKDKLDAIEEEARQEELGEKKREMEFPDKFPQINRLWGVRWIVRWMYKEGWWYSALVIILLVIGFSIRLYRLGDLSLWWDETITGEVVTRIRETGLPLEPSGLEYYWRGIAYHYFVVLFTYLFGLTEFAIRFPSLLFGMGIVLLSFLVGKKINKIVGLFVLIFMTFSTFNIEYSRFARFYIMNAFLFMLSIFIVYEGFFKDKMKYKILSLIIFLIMVHTVQLGSFFLFVLGSYFIYELIRFTKSEEELKKIVTKNKINFIFCGFALIIFIFDNLFQTLFSISLIRAYEEIETVPAPPSYPIVKIPEWDLFYFMNGSHIPVIFLFIFLIYLLLNLSKNMVSDRKQFLIYISIIFFISVISFESLNREVVGARIYLIFEGLYAVLSLYSIFSVLKIYIKQQKVLKFVSLISVVLLIMSITPNFYERITIDYGDDVSHDSFRTTYVAAYRADYKTQYLYLDEHIQIGDIWINIMNSPYFYINKIPDYFFNQNYRWNTYALLDENGNFRTDEGSILINSANNLEDIIANNPSKRIWLVVNGGSVNILSTTHVRSDFLRFLETNEDKVIYESPDGYSRILLFNN
ncbi:Dolichyl-phosphate-mannose-protein mannosyltransferase [uncultured archaeon]|nr:Dolichyl-phosphate-mannose-protein mannosyltransferase [uncultured archaeon]